MSTKKSLFDKRKFRNRLSIKKNIGNKLRLTVFRSNKHIYCQLIDDVKGITLAAASSMEKDLGVVGKNNVAACSKVGTELAKRAKSAGISECYFDRGGFLFHGGIKALADAAREGGLKF